MSDQRCEIIDYELMRRQTQRVSRQSAKKVKTEAAQQMIRMVSCEFLKNGAIFYDKANKNERSLTSQMSMLSKQKKNKFNDSQTNILSTDPTTSAIN